MTREEIMELLYDDPEVCRPPLENESALQKYTLAAWLPRLKDNLLSSVDRLIREAEERGEV